MKKTAWSELGTLTEEAQNDFGIPSKTMEENHEEICYVRKL